MRAAIEICFALALLLMVIQRAMEGSLAPIDLLAAGLIVIGIMLGFVAALAATVFA